MGKMAHSFKAPFILLFIFIGTSSRFIINANINNCLDLVCEIALKLVLDIVFARPINQKNFRNPV